MSTKLSYLEACIEMLGLVSIGLTYEEVLGYWEFYGIEVEQQGEA